MDATARGAVTGVASNGKAEVTGSSGHLVLSAELMIGYFGHSSYDLQGADQDASDLIRSAHSSSDEFSDKVNTPTLPLHDPSIRPCHYYIDIPNGDDNTYQPSERHVSIDPNFQSHLQEEQEAGDFITFLVLPKIIPARKHKNQQPLLDFTKSNILTSRAYSEGCKCMLAQREATQNEAKQKVAEREANKEIRRKEKE